jgi:ubiquinone/menaquinone biosynthesis C-methylase UbiE
MRGRDGAVPQIMLPRGLAGRIAYFLMSKGHGAIYKNVAEVLAPQADDELLDIPCGNGYFLRKYASQVRSVAGVDLSELGISLASRMHAARIAAGTAEFACSDASRLPWDDDRFSAVTSMSGLPGFPQPEETLRQIHRVLRPGGRAVISIEWNAEDGKDHAKEHAKYGFRIWTEEDVRSLMKEAGFPDVSITYKGALGTPKMMLVRALKQ